jgi:acyl-CoA reductase-like NAD-dependent aldehyde dehydrogenase
MTDQAENQFDSIESAHEYLNVLAQVLADTQAAIQDDIAAAQAQSSKARQVDALQLVDYKLHRLGEHLRSSRRLLNDLRTLRRLLNGDRAPALEPAPVTVARTTRA